MSKVIFPAFALALAAWTQLTHLTAVPGLHFDEAWQGLFAHRIATEPGFWPIEAMNAYTTPVLHYLLAISFKLFGPALAVMRGTLALLNFTSLALMMTVLWREGHARAAGVFALLWALLPLSIHDHRFSIEVTAFHGLCFALAFFGVSIWRARPRLAFLLIVPSSILGVWSHVGYIAVWLSGLLIIFAHHENEVLSARGRRALGFVHIAAAALLVRMGVGLGKPMPLILAAALVLICIRPSLLSIASKKLRAIVLLSLPLVAAFALLHFDGIWPYAQATGALPQAWIPANLVFAIFLFWIERTQGKATDRARVAFSFFAIVLLATVAIVFKPSPRFFMVAAMAAMLWISLRLETFDSQRIKTVLLGAFTLWNGFAFQILYIDRFERFGAEDKPVEILFVKDSGRDFRPFQKAWRWVVEQNCQTTLSWVEDDRFKRPIEFLALTTPPPTGPCPWKKDDLFFSHIPNRAQLSDIPRTAENTPPPTPEVKLLAHRPEWGDLAFWIRR